MDPVVGGNWIKFLLGKLGGLIRRREDWNNSPRIQERRRWIYDSLVGVRGNIIRDAVTSPNDLNVLKEARAEAELYAPEVEPHIREWIVQAAALETAHGVLSTPDRGNPNVDRSKWIEKSHEALLFFSGPAFGLGKKFKPLIGSK